MQRLFAILLIFIVALYSCTNNTINKKERQLYPTYAIGDTSAVSHPYMATGFYFLADKNEGISMQKDHTNEVYKISKQPFVSVDNIMRASLHKVPTESGIYTNMNMVLDNKGTKDLEEGTGNPLHPYMAVVIANKLLYVVENQNKIPSGVMEIILEDYTEEEMQLMLDAVNNKR